MLSRWLTSTFLKNQTDGRSGEDVFKCICMDERTRFVAARRLGVVNVTSGICIILWLRNSENLPITLEIPHLPLRGIDEANHVYKQTRASVDQQE